MIDSYTLGSLMFLFANQNLVNAWQSQSLYCCNYLHNIDNIPKPIITTNEVENFANETVYIILEWTVQEEILGLRYNITVSPQANIQYNGMKTAQLSLSYNVPYNVSVVALCGTSSSPPLPIELNYSKSLSNMTTVQTRCFFMLFTPITQLNVLIHLVY